MKRLGSDSHFLTETLPAPSSLLSTSLKTTGSKLFFQLSKEEQNNNKFKHHHSQTFNKSMILRSANNNDNSDETDRSNESSYSLAIDSTDEHKVGSIEQKSPFIHHALSSITNRHQISLTDGSNRISASVFKRHLMKRYIVKRNFPNNQLSRASSEDDSNEIELNGTDDKENDDDDDYIKEEKTNGLKQQHKNSHQEDRLDIDVGDGDDENDNNNNDESDLKKSKIYVPYWDAYDIVNQLFLEMSK